jgi:hypothetical protein
MKLLLLPSIALVAIATFSSQAGAFPARLDPSLSAPLASEFTEVKMSRAKHARMMSTMKRSPGMMARHKKMHPRMNHQHHSM